MSLFSKDAHSSISGAVPQAIPTQLDLEDPHNWILNPRWVARQTTAMPTGGCDVLLPSCWQGYVWSRSMRCQSHRAYPEVILSHCHNFNLPDKKRSYRHTPTLAKGSTDASVHECVFGTGMRKHSREIAGGGAGRLWKWAFCSVKTRLILAFYFGPCFNEAWSPFAVWVQNRSPMRFMQKEKLFFMMGGWGGGVRGVASLCYVAYYPGSELSS